MRAAFKEWAVVVDALGRGDQIVLLRKGGILEGRSGFQVEHSQFLLFPTLFHQQREAVTADAQARYDVIVPGLPPPEIVRLEFYADVVASRQLEALSVAQGLRGQHIWRDEVIAARFDWGRAQNIFALAVRVFRLPRAVELPMSPLYAGCKSWVELEEEISVSGGHPVLDEPAFDRKLKLLLAALQPVPA